MKLLKIDPINCTQGYFYRQSHQGREACARVGVVKGGGAETQSTAEGRVSSGGMVEVLPQFRRKR